MMQGRNERNGFSEEELATKSFQLYNKRFYLDVKENGKGRFIKITEVDLRNRKSRILMTMPTVKIMLGLIEQAVIENDNCKTVGNKASDENNNKKNGGRETTREEAGIIFSDTIVKRNRNYQIAMKENNRGRFLRITMSTLYNFSRIAVPVEGVGQLQDKLQELFDEFHAGYDNFDIEDQLPESQAIRSSSKRFYFDSAISRSGIILQISEVRESLRTSIVIREGYWAQFRDVLAEVSAELSEKDKWTAEDELPAARQFRAQRTGYHFTVGVNNFGVYLRITEVRPTNRVVLMVPGYKVAQFHQILDGMVKCLDDVDLGLQERAVAKKANGGHGVAEAVAKAAEGDCGGGSEASDEQI